MRRIALAVLIAAAASSCGANTGVPFDVAGAPSGDVNSIASRCVSADLAGQTTGTYLMKFPRCAGQ